MHFLFRIRWTLVFACGCIGGVVGSSSRAAAPPALQVVETTDPKAWPWWRGPNRDGHARSGQLPLRFSATERVEWKAPVPGRGHSSPIVSAGKVFLTSADEQKQSHLVLAYDLISGRQLWSKLVSQGGFPANNHPKNTEASSTLASDSQRLYATFYHHDQVELIALDFDGELQWRTRAGEFHPTMYEYGYAPSPVLYGELVIVAAEHDHESSSIAAFDRTTGAPRWRTARTPSISFSSPVVAHVAGRDQLLISGQVKVSSYDPTSGELLWEVAGTTHATCGTMIWDDSVVYASGGYPAAETLAVRADGSGQVLWRNNQKCYEQSMILADGCVYALTDKGVLYCWLASDGTELWRERLEGPVSASPIYAAGHIYWANEDGTYYVFKPNREKFELVATNRLGSEAFASPAVSGSRLLLRSAEGKGTARKETLYCLTVE